VDSRYCGVVAGGARVGRSLVPLVEERRPSERRPHRMRRLTIPTTSEGCWIHRPRRTRRVSRRSRPSCSLRARIAASVLIGGVGAILGVVAGIGCAAYARSPHPRCRYSNYYREKDR
jgi:hypothetical protein